MRGGLGHRRGFPGPNLLDPKDGPGTDAWRQVYPFDKQYEFSPLMANMGSLNWNEPQATLVTA